MRKLSDWFANVMAAAAFAEEGETETARLLAAEDGEDEVREPDMRIEPISRTPRRGASPPRRSRA